mmetsp:Transcript_21795/g.70421  ORF Transcript_21795/g.70421 Transcript_21795/m.70421 type:complete len:281 (+) Transcript_21795:780-1622(+)
MSEVWTTWPTRSFTSCSWFSTSPFSSSRDAPCPPNSAATFRRTPMPPTSPRFSWSSSQRWDWSGCSSLATSPSCPLRVASPSRRPPPAWRRRSPCRSTTSGTSSSRTSGPPGRTRLLLSSGSCSSSSLAWMYFWTWMTSSTSERWSGTWPSPLWCCCSCPRATSSRATACASSGRPPRSPSHCSWYTSTTQPRAASLWPSPSPSAPPDIGTTSSAGGQPSLGTGSESFSASPCSSSPRVSSPPAPTTRSTYRVAQRTTPRRGHREFASTSRRQIPVGTWS